MTPTRLLQGGALALATALATACSTTPTAPPSAGDAPAAGPALLTPQELQALPRRAPDHRLSYGPDSNQHGELRLPDGPGPHPVVVLVHGGCFKAAYATASDLAPMADALEDAGIASWNIEYRRLGHPGGGWPGTYLDVGTAIDHLRTLAARYPLDLDRVVLAGHSAGGHLALWAAARDRVPAAGDLHMPDPLPVRGVVDLAGPVDLTVHVAEYQALCRDTVITDLLGGTPATVPARYAQASPASLLPLGVPQVVVIGDHEDFVPHPIAAGYVDAAVRAGDEARLVVIPDAGHFEVASPRAHGWPTVFATMRALLEGGAPTPRYRPPPAP